MPPRSMADKMGKYWNPSQPAFFEKKGPSNYNGDEDEDDDGSDMSEWASENEDQPLQKPVFESMAREAEWMRKQRNREYRVAARREKRNRKADEKKQRKLNATILRRMTKNPDKYNKNVERNRKREVELERRKIYKEAISQAERLAAFHDPTGKMFNVGPVVTQEDGRVVSLELLERKAQTQAEREAKLAIEAASEVSKPKPAGENPEVNGVNALRQKLIQIPGEIRLKRMSKNQQKKLAALEDRPPPPKPVIPEGIELPEGEENWLTLWNLSDDELERRVLREKKRKAAERKALRSKQKEGKSERRAARDERRKVYREKKLEWKAIKEEEKVRRRKLLRVEQEEAKRIAIEVNVAERTRAMEVCAELGFTLENVEGVSEIKPKALGMKGQEVDFDILEVGDRPSELKIKDGRLATKMNDNPRGNRVDLGKAPEESKTKLIASVVNEAPAGGLDDDFVSFDFEGEKFEGQEFEGLNYNHKLRRKLHRAIEAAQIKKELLVRERAKEHCVTNGIAIPAELAVEYSPIKLTGRRTLEDGTIETEKQERVRKRLELAEYNKAAKVLRAQAKAVATEAGLRVFAELTGKRAIQEDDIPTSIDNSSSLEDAEVSADADATKAEVWSNKRRRNFEDSEVIMETKAKKSKQSSHSDVPAVVGELVTGETSKKVKKSSILGFEEKAGFFDDQSSKKLKNGRSDYGNEEEEETARKGKTRAKKEKRARDSEETLRDADLELQGNSTKAPSQKSKKIKTKNDSEELTEEKCSKNDKNTKKLDEIVSGAEHWNPKALRGDATRKDKFLRLLGAGKINGTKKSEKHSKKEASSKSPADFAALEIDLQRQFETGVRMKHDGHGRRRGLGA